MEIVRQRRAGRMGETSGADRQINQSSGEENVHRRAIGYWGRRLGRVFQEDWQILKSRGPTGPGAALGLSPVTAASCRGAEPIGHGGIGKLAERAAAGAAAAYDRRCAGTPGRGLMRC